MPRRPLLFQEGTTVSPNRRHRPPPLEYDIVSGVKYRPAGLDPLFNLAEQQAADYSRFPQQVGSKEFPLLGLLTSEDVEKRVRELRYLDVDSYVAAAVYPSEDPNRPGAPLGYSPHAGRDPA